MHKIAVRGLLLTVAMLTMLAVAANSAQATVTPVNARLSGTSPVNGTSLSLDPPLPAQTVRCPTAELTGRVNAAGTSITGGRLTFSGNAAARTTCQVNSGDSALVSCPGTFTLNSVASVRSTSASFDLVISRTGAETEACSVRNLVSGATVNVDFQTIRGCITYTQATGILNINRCTVVVTIARAISGTATFTGTYRVLDSATRRAPTIS